METYVIQPEIAQHPNIKAFSSKKYKNVVKTIENDLLLL